MLAGDGPAMRTRGEKNGGVARGKTLYDAVYDWEAIVLRI